ncbi:DNA polymerase alpha subunit B, variant 2 [Bonamia ostreae]|uniref:DNA polymerase alpha subunit B n=1 Tax=Bonamia ostreae TaxID=126728 RepID=A0ABV2AIU3_9EUKA
MADQNYLSEAQSFSIKTTNNRNKEKRQTAKIEQNAKKTKTDQNGLNLNRFEDFIANKNREKLNIDLKNSSNHFRFVEPVLERRHEALQKRIDFIANRFKKLQKIDNFEFTAVSALSESVQNFVIGFVAKDGESRLNKKNIYLQGCQSISNGEKISLNLDAIKKSISLFPGQVLVVKGSVIEEPRRELMATEIFDDFYSKKPENFSIENAFDFVFVSGPYFGPDNVKYEKSFLPKFAEILKEKAPSVLIMTGPFVSEDFPMLPNLNKTFSETFSDLMKSFFEDIETLFQVKSFKVLVIPSTKDVNATPFYPQPSFKNLTINENLHFLTNPASFSINGCKFCVTAADTVFDILQSDLRLANGEKTTKNGERWENLSSHLLRQKWLYPIYPPKNEKIDFENYSKLKIADDSEPNVLIWTSPSTKISNRLANCFVCFVS